MIFTEQLAATVEVSKLMLQRMPEQTMAAARDELRKRIVKAGEDVGAFISLKSVLVIERERNPQQATVKISGVWSPKQAELRGGQADGQVMNVPRDAMSGYPPSTITLPNIAGVYREPLEASPQVTQSTTYRCEGIDGEHDRWVYRA